MVGRRRFGAIALIGRRSLAALVLLVSVVALAPLTPAFAAFPGANGKIAFDGYPGGMQTINPDGSGRTTLIPYGSGLHPAWSPDGTKIAFASGRHDGNAEIYVMNADGGGQTRVTNDPAPDYAPTWSPDGSRIAFMRGTNVPDIYTINTDGSGEANLTNTPSSDEFDPAWSPSGNKIAFNSGSTLATINVDGTARTSLPSAYRYIFPDPSEGCFFAKSDWSPDWSPDGQKLVYVHEEQDDCSGTYVSAIHTINVDGTGEQGLYALFDGNYLETPAWSPDGSMIVAVSGDVQMFLIDSNGNYVRALVSYPPDDASHPDWQPLRPPGYARPKGARPASVKLVPAYEPCTSANASHGAPLEAASCSPPVPASAHLAIGASSTGTIVFDSICNPPAPNPLPPCADPGDQADVSLTASVTDVRNKASLTDYIGELRVAVPARITDRFNGAGSVHPGTALDTPIAFNVTCQSTLDEAVGSTCSAQTSADALMPGFALEGKRAVWQLGQVQVYDGGSDGDADTAGDNTLFMKQGVFVP